MKTNNLLKNKIKLKRKICYIFQGGGALGIYQVGAYKAFIESGYLPDMLVGISIGGINAAIIAGNPPEKRIDKLEQFWRTVTTDFYYPSFADKLNLTKFYNFIGSTFAMNGIPGFYYPRIFNPLFMPSNDLENLSYYDTSPLRTTLSNLIDFNYLNEKHIRLCLGVVELSEGKFEFFDNTNQEITVDHILATGALPPGFAPVKIKDKYYIDGGVYNNNALSKIFDEFADNVNNVQHLLCFMVDLFSSSGPYPHSFDGLLERVKDIKYSSHSRRGTSLYASSQNLSHAIHYLSTILTEEQKNLPNVSEILKLGLSHKLDVVRLIYRSEKGTELHSKDYNFSATAAKKHYDLGYQSAVELINKKKKMWENNDDIGLTIYSPDN